MTASLTSAPVLATPETAEAFAVWPTPPDSSNATRPSDDVLHVQYEIARTAAEIRSGGWTDVVGLQFPDDMLSDAPWVVEALTKELQKGDNPDAVGENAEQDKVSVPRLYVLADTSYSPCCVDEIAAQHASAQAVVHYGRACLSPTARLPTVYVFTRRELDLDGTVHDFEEFVGHNKQDKVVVVADVLYQSHVDEVVQRLLAVGYEAVLGTSIAHDPTGIIPNRRVTKTGQPTELDPDEAKSYALFHLGQPPTSLLLALSSRFRTFAIHAPWSSDSLPTPASTAALLRRRYARVVTTSTAGIIGILVNTLSVANYLSSLETIRSRIAAAGKKSYTVVVGKVNPAKLANFQEIETWVVVGCWEGGLIDGEGFWRPVVTPFELELALTDESERVWGGDWWGGIEQVQGWTARDAAKEKERAASELDREQDEQFEHVEGGVEDEESEPPEYDWRTGRLVSHSRPMRAATASARKAPDGDDVGPESSADGTAGTLIKRAPGEIASINGVASPGAEYLRSKRTWQGLGTDFDPEETSTHMEEGRSGMARGYVVGDDTSRR